MNRLQNTQIEALFNTFPPIQQKALLEIRELIFVVAAKTEGVGLITETLKWGQASYLTEQTGAGTTVRIDRVNQNQIAIFFHCQTTLIATFRTLFPELNYSKNRAILFELDKPLPLDTLSLCIEMALTYKLRK